MKKLLIVLLLLLSACTKTEDECSVDAYPFANSLETLSSSEVIFKGTFKEGNFIGEGGLDYNYFFVVEESIKGEEPLSEIRISIGNGALKETQFCSVGEKLHFTPIIDETYILFLEYTGSDIYVPVYQQFAYIENGDKFTEHEQLGYVSGLSNEVTLEEIKEYIK